MINYHSYLFLLFIQSTNTYIIPQTFRYFFPVGIYNNKNNLYEFKLGTLPFITWFPNENNPITIINSCKHIGNNLKNSKLTNNKNCIVCPFHNTIYNNSDNFGTTIIKNNIIWWSYKNIYNNPPYLKNNHINPKQININVNYMHIILNIINLYFNDISKDYKYFYNIKKQRLFIKNNIFKLYYIFPFSFFLSEYKSSTSFITLLPIDNHNTKIYFINYNDINKLKKYMEYSYNPYTFKYMTSIKDTNSISYKIKKIFENFHDFNDFSVFNFLKNHKFL